MGLDISQKVETIMTTNLITLKPSDTLSDVKEIFSIHNIHHIPIKDDDKIVGIVSKSDLEYHERHYDHLSYGDMLEQGQLDIYKLEDVMTRGLAILPPEAPISEALELFKENIFHAIPIEKDDRLVGIVTPHDVISALAE